MTAGEAHDFGQLYGTEKFTDFSAHPKDKGWSGGIGPDGRPTSAAGLFQDEQGTWHIIQQKYGLRDFSATSQVGGNLRFAADLYHERTGRSLLADFKAGNTTSIAATLHDQWPSLGGGGSSAADASDPAFQQYRKVQQAGIDRLSKMIDRLGEEASRDPAGSAERHEKLRRMMEHSEELQHKYEKLNEAPPRPMSPFEAAGEMTPLLIGLVTLAGAFTRRPALGAINALGSALGGLKQGNDEQYKNAVDLWSKQTDHAAKAFGMQNDEIDAIMRDQQMEERERQNKLTNAFRVLGLERDVELAKGNMWETIYKRQDDRRKLAADLDEKAAMTKEHLSRAHQLDAGGSTQFGVALRANINKFVEDNQRQPTAAENDQIVGRTINEVKGKGRQGTEQGYIDDALKAEADKRQTTVDQLPADVRRDVTSQAHQDWSQSGQAGRTAGSAVGQARHDVEKLFQAQNTAAGKPAELTPEQKVQVDQQVATFSHQAKVSGNKEIDLQKHVDQLGYSMQTINDTFKLMDQYGMIAGVGGALLRPAEAVGNVLGTYGDTARGEFQSHLEYLRMTGARLLANTMGRPLSGEEKRIDTIIRGLNLGDTTARTYESLNELMQLYTDMRRQTLSQINRTWQPIPVPESPGTHSPYVPGRAPTGEAGGGAAAPGAGPATVATPGFDAYPDAR
jgi:muramidase (phage lysozyme)